MVGTKEDRRITRTRKLLTEALIALSLEKGYQAVTIRDITERAGVGYATFFRHYPAKEALLVDVLETFLEDVIGLVIQQAAEQDPAASGRIVFEHAQKHSELYLLLMASRGSSDLLERVYEVAAEGISRLSTPRSGASVPFDIAVNHLISSFLGLITWWLQNGMPYPPERMGQISADLIIRPTQQLAFEPMWLPQSQDHQA